jgi:hypothetical protein
MSTTSSPSGIRGGSVSGDRVLWEIGRMKKWYGNFTIKSEEIRPKIDH